MRTIGILALAAAPSLSGAAHAAASKRESPPTRAPGPAASASPVRGSLVVTVGNLATAKGKVCVALFARAEGFPGDFKAASKTACVEPGGSETRVSFTGIAPGTYAISAIHDENDDGILNTGAFGIPKEGFGFSNNPPVRMGAPGFRECTFAVSGPTTASIRMRVL